MVCVATDAGVFSQKTLEEEFIPTTGDKIHDDHVQDTIFEVTNETELEGVE